MALQETQMSVDDQEDRDRRVCATMMLELTLNTPSIVLVLESPTNSTCVAPTASSGTNVLDNVGQDNLLRLV